MKDGAEPQTKREGYAGASAGQAGEGVGKKGSPRRAESTAWRRAAPAWALVTKARAPMRLAFSTISLELCMESMTMAVSGEELRISRVAEMPSMMGMEMSMMMICGFKESALETASLPLEASPQISTSLREERMAQTPFLTDS